MRSYLQYLTLALALMISWGCQKDPVNSGRTEDGMIRVRMLVTTPQARFGNTRAVDEDALNAVSVLVMENLGSGYVYQYTVIGYSLGTSQVADYEFLARLVPTTNPVKLLLVGNGGAAVNNVAVGMSEQQVKQVVTMDFTSAGFTNALPMSGEVELTGGLTTDNTVSAVLVRSVARVDIVNSATSDFTLTSVKVYRASDKIQLIANVMVDNVVASPSIPAGTSRSVNSATLPVSGATVTQQIYIPESAIPQQGDRTLTATTIVVGGRYGSETRTTYYRMDFIPDGTNDQFGQVLRNHLYRFNITDVLAPGWLEEDQASVYPSSDLEAEVKVWNDVDMYMVFDNIDYFGVSTRNVNLNYRPGDSGTIVVDTSLGTYSAYWSDSDGNIDQSIPPISLGGTFTDPDDRYEVSISADGTAITVTAIERYQAANLPKYLKLIAGRLEILITIDQSPPVYGPRSAVNVFNANQEIGSFGNWVIPGAATNLGGRSEGLVPILRSTVNFGPGGTVPIEGIFISGLPLENTMPAQMIELYNVLYLTYARNPPAATVLDWLGALQQRVIIVQYDNTATNANVMAALGLTYNGQSGKPIQPFTLSDSAPDFITDGPFGTVEGPLQFRCRDDTYGTMTIENATANGFIPVILSSSGDVVMSVNPARRIVLCGDIDIYSQSNLGSSGIYISGTSGNVGNQIEILLANLWAWITETVIAE